MSKLRHERNDYAVVRGETTIATYDSLGDAVSAWRPLRRNGARLVKLHESGWMFAAIIGDAWVRTRGRPDLAKRTTKKSVVVGWNRVVPLYRGARYWDTTATERASMFPGKLVVSTRMESVRRRTEERRRLRDSRIRPPAPMPSKDTKERP